jgi:hypothetical protein
MVRRNSAKNRLKESRKLSRKLLERFLPTNSIEIPIERGAVEMAHAENSLTRNLSISDERQKAKSPARKIKVYAERTLAVDQD